MKIKYLFYEWILLLLNCSSSKGSYKKGFYDDKKIYEKKSWLNWKVKKIGKKRYENKDFRI